MNHHVLRRLATGLTVAWLGTVSFMSVGLAADEAYLGAWKIDSAVVAPWAAKGRTPPATDVKVLVGKTLTLKPKEIAGPEMLACKGPKYKLSDFPADMLFQGAFGEMHGHDESVDPAKVAATLGFQGDTWKVLETGCDNAIDMHFIDARTLAIGFNDYVYFLKKQ